MANPKGNQKPWSPSARDALKRHVATLLARAFEEFEIVREISRPVNVLTVKDDDGNDTEVERPNEYYSENPRTGKPYTQRTVNRIIHELREEWAEENRETIRKERAQVIAENKLIRRDILSLPHPMRDYSSLNAAHRNIAAWLPEMNAPIQFSEMTEEEIDRLLNERFVEYAKLIGIEGIAALLGVTVSVGDDAGSEGGAFSALGSEDSGS